MQLRVVLIETNDLLMGGWRGGHAPIKPSHLDAATPSLAQYEKRYCGKPGRHLDDRQLI